MKKTIVFCTDSLNIGGIEKALINLSNALIKDNKYNIKICVKNYEKNYLQGLLDEKIEVTYITREKKQQYLFRIFEKIREFNRFKKFVDNSEIIIDYYDGNFYKWFSKIKNKKKIVYFHTILPKLHIYKTKDLNEILTKIYDKYIVLTEGAKNELVENGVRKEKIEKIYNIIDYKSIELNGEDTSDLTEEERLNIEKEYFITIGRLVSDSKDYETLLKAFSKINENLYIVGEGPYRKEIEKTIKELKIEDRVKLIGAKKNPYIWLKKSKGLILSSKYEGLSNVILEALVLEKRVISSDCPYGPREILKNSEFGELFKVGDEIELARIISGSNKKIEKNIIMNEFFEDNILKKTYKTICD